jgi:hypothetical protein
MRVEKITRRRKKPALKSNRVLKRKRRIRNVSVKKILVKANTRPGIKAAAQTVITPIASVYILQ